ncbi:acyl-ACP--UDP-N-acetylglucosamine O-acyltransferase [Fimbriimonas ginsengisoli]|uniref:Acyl-(Acyl-carrier-protein)--UDP-N-acetylglucosamine O-acyltransferase n=1 Tax=Fimbriimonas ginsengisoli Gsoil 348 TaxID=661478 RepID=A0A068NQL2_FIMGI|nr:acyl-ACP--UDP-N-acetylglucosamine O-acyltransferase [Fimbriimonas ginsengisoli]AIE85652.1 acyl-(acyl-carrier-protein)--UDP-N-acetylglucosamine O-acyltransferase [Fimbriimonas ginsengisoli Gsoil 348]
MAKIHKLAFVDPSAELAADVEVGPFSYVEPGVVIGARTKLDSHATVKRGTTVGEDNFIGQGTVLGGDPQDRKYKGEPTFLKIGDRNVFREYVTVHRATGEGLSTLVGDDNYVMAYCHLGHNVVMHNFVTIANNTGVSGHVTIEDLVTIGGMSGIHQFCRIGKVGMVGGMTKITRDAPPFMLVEGPEQEVHDINAIGLRRIGVTPQARLALHKACKLLYKSQLGLRNAMEIVRREVVITPEVQYLLDFEDHRSGGRNGRGDQR